MKSSTTFIIILLSLLLASCSKVHVSDVEFMETPDGHMIVKEGKAYTGKVYSPDEMGIFSFDNGKFVGLEVKHTNGKTALKFQDDGADGISKYYSEDGSELNEEDFFEKYGYLVHHAAGYFDEYYCLHCSYEAAKRLREENSHWQVINGVLKHVP